jgi:hypothetical protein
MLEGHQVLPSRALSVLSVARRRRGPRSPRRRWTVPRAVSEQPPAITVALSLRGHGSAYDASPRGTADNPAPA